MTNINHTNTTPATDTVVTFTADTMTIGDNTYPVAYSITPTGRVFVFTTEDNGKRTRICIDQDSPYYHDALCAAKPELLAQTDRDDTSTDDMEDTDPDFTDTERADAEYLAAITFTPTTATVFGTVYQAQYTISDSAHVSMILTGDTLTLKLNLTPNDAYYAEALRAAQTTSTDKPQTPKPPVNHTAAPVDKPWIGSTIKGKAGKFTLTAPTTEPA